jgi:hypothetical protein
VKRVWACLGLVFVVTVLAQPRDTEVRRGGILFRNSVSPGEEMTAARLLERARELLGSGGADAAVDLQIFPTTEAMATNCKCRTDVTYGVWRAGYEEALRGLGAEGEIVAAGGSAVVRFRGANGSVSRNVVGAADPLTIKGPSCNAEILRMSPIVDGAQGDEVEFYVKSTSATRSCAEGVAAALVSRFGAHRYRLRVREDAWFLEDEGFPFVFPFADIGQPPTRRAYYASRQSGCDGAVGALRCWQRGGTAPR